MESEVDISAGFLIVKTFERMYRDYLVSFEKYWQASSHVTYDPIPLEQMPGRYRGVARDPIEPWNEEFRGAGLFDTPAHAQEYANSFPLLPEHERPDHITEVRIFI